MKKTSFLLLLPLFAMAVFACKKEDTSCKTTYEKHVKAIIDNSCAYAGCHSGATAGQWVPAPSKDYTTYEGMKVNLYNGKFAERTLHVQDMPPNKYVPADRDTVLSAGELDILACWMENEFAEK